MSSLSYDSHNNLVHFFGSEVILLIEVIFHHYQNGSCQVLSGPEEAGLALPQVQPTF